MSRDLLDQAGLLIETGRQGWTAADRLRASPLPDVLALALDEDAELWATPQLIQGSAQPTPGEPLVLLVLPLRPDQDRLVLGLGPAQGGAAELLAWRRVLSLDRPPRPAGRFTVFHPLQAWPEHLRWTPAALERAGLARVVGGGLNCWGPDPSQQTPLQPGEQSDVILRRMRHARAAHHRRGGSDTFNLTGKLAAIEGCTELVGCVGEPLGCLGDAAGTHTGCLDTGCLDAGCLHVSLGRLFLSVLQR